MITTSKSSTTLSFNSIDRREWLKEIAQMYYALHNGQMSSDIVFRFDNFKQAGVIRPIHMVTLACLIESMDKAGKIVKLHREKDPIGEFLWTNLKFKEYWSGRKNYVEANDINIFNLWRLKDDEKEIVPIRVHEYFKRHYFKNKDLSSVKTSLDETYYNVFDHADAKGNAFSFLQYDDKKERLSIAVCDFGKGIPTTVRNYQHDVGTDVDALRLASKDKFTIKSREHNSGMGIGNIVSSGVDGDSVWIFSKGAYLVAQNGEIRCGENDFDFPGTAIFYYLSLSKFEEEEIIDTFEL